ncbi:helix-turn-helix domain-containing protein [Paenibacillus flagellatus]|uniref:DNA-binding response regulator n=1 Tax=Paenibacillus flagellatus TaxID=2211139 RepID=A0A2V5KCL6_9BACL|nr:helix-turn-helix domain-containing protein [Paenibacillus flagellatus]PYI57351.1 DNA-binding response regulator [Paenibacillus flagellatus]
MIALIAVHERRLRKKIRSSADWAEAGFEDVIEAENEPAALAAMRKHKPELLIADWGLFGDESPESLGRLQAVVPSCKTIVVTDSRDKSRLREAVKWGVSDLLLLPFDRKQLNESVRNAAELWKRDERSRVRDRDRTVEVDRMKRLYRDKLLSDLLSDASRNDTVTSALAREFPELHEARSYRIAILSLDTISLSVRDKFAFQTDLLFFSLLNVCGDFLQVDSAGIAFRPWNSDRELVLLLTNRPENAVPLLSAMHKAIERQLETRIDIGIGTTVRSTEQLPQSYKEAAQALRKRNLLEEGGWIHQYDGSEKPTADKLHFADFEEDVRLAVRSGKPERIRAAVSSWIQAVRKLDRITVDQVELWRHEYNVVKERWQQFFFQDGTTPSLQLPSEKSAFLVPMDDRGKLSITLWQTELTESLLRLAKRLEDRPSSRGGVAMSEVESYLRHNYHRDLTLQDIADRFYLSREHISRKFKQHFGENFVDTLCRIRLDKACALLSNPQLKIAEVAQLVGYQDEKYFSKVFKKRKGLSPNAFRKLSKLR